LVRRKRLGSTQANELMVTGLFFMKSIGHSIEGYSYVRKYLSANP
jgi:hypothetical protein